MCDRQTCNLFPIGGNGRSLKKKLEINYCIKKNKTSKKKLKERKKKGKGMEADGC